MDDNLTLGLLEIVISAYVITSEGELSSHLSANVGLLAQTRTEIALPMSSTVIV